MYHCIELQKNRDKFPVNQISEKEVQSDFFMDHIHLFISNYGGKYMCLTKLKNQFFEKKKFDL